MGCCRGASWKACDKSQPERVHVGQMTAPVSQNATKYKTSHDLVRSWDVCRTALPRSLLNFKIRVAERACEWPIRATVEILSRRTLQRGCHRVAQALRPAYNCCCGLGFDPGGTSAAEATRTASFIMQCLKALLYPEVAARKTCIDGPNDKRDTLLKGELVADRAGKDPCQAGAGLL